MRRTLISAALCAVSVAAAGPQAARPALYPLSSTAKAAWDEYLKVTEFRIKKELEAPTRFLALDFATGGDADRQAVLDKKTPVAQMTSVWENGTTVTVPDYWVHHWRGAILLPNLKLDAVFERLKKDMPGKGQPGVLKAEIRQENWPQLHTYIQVQRSGSVLFIPYNYVYNTEHDVEFTRRSHTTGTSKTVATKIAELDHPGGRDEREKKPDEEDRLLLRWNSYWRYQEIGIGVIAECESVTLSLDPGTLASLAGGHGIAEKAAQEAMKQALVNLRSFFQTPPSSSPAR